MINLETGVHWERLTAETDPLVEFLTVEYPPGAASCDEDSLVRHGGKEYGYVTEGRLGVRVGFDEFELAPGMAISFDASMPHRLWAIGAQPARALWIVVGRQSDARGSNFERWTSACPCVVAGAEPVDDDHRLVADDPGVVAARQRGDVAGAGDELGAVVHADREPPAHVVLEVRRLAAVGAGDRLHVVRPAPARLRRPAGRPPRRRRSGSRRARSGTRGSRPASSKLLCSVSA